MSIYRNQFRLSPCRLVGVVAVMTWGISCRPADDSSARLIDLSRPSSTRETLPVAGWSPSIVGASVASSPDEPATIRFRDVSTTTGIAFVHRSGNSPEKRFPTANGSGVAMLDFDGDGWIDLYFATTRELPLDAPSDIQGNRLYRNRGDGTFEDVTRRAGVGYRGFNHGLAVGDVNNDGHPDLYLTNLGGNVLYLNNGDGTFRDATTGSGAACGTWSSGAAFLDYDRDGDLDTYVTCYGQWNSKAEHLFCGDENKGVRTYCSPTTITPERHYLLRNRGDGTFEDVTERAGILRRDGRGLGVVACDVDRDGWIDLYVANDLSPHFLFLNRGDGTFEDATDRCGAAASEAGHFQAGMGVDAEDIDGDGLPELFATHFREDYSTLYRNLDGRNFQDVSAGAGIVKDSMPDVGWGCALADLDNDGWPDMLVVNGHVDDNLPLIGQNVPQAERAKVWRNRGDGRFRLVRDPGPFFDQFRVARGAAFGDLDNDGDIDVVVSLMDSLPAVLLNESPPRPWIRIDLRCGPGDRAAIGARVEVHAGGRVIHRQLKGGGSYLSTNDPRLLIGLGAAERVDRIEIVWPNGSHSTLNDPALRQTHRVREPSGSSSSQ